MTEMPPFQHHRISTRDGVRLSVRDHGPREAAPVICLAGLSRSDRDFRSLAHHLTTQRHRPRRVLTINARGRGDSEHDRNWRNYTPLVEAQDVLDVMTALDIAKAAFVGTSRGGILAILLGSLRPTALQAVVLNDIGPEIDMRGLARIKSYLAAPPVRLNGWTEAIVALQKSQGTHFPAFSLADWEIFARMTFADEGGRPVRDFDPALLKPMESIDFQQAPPTLWPQFSSLRHVPVLALRGELSDILSADTVARMARIHPQFDAMEIAGQGHAPMLHDPAILDRITTFLANAARQDR